MNDEIYICDRCGYTNKLKSNLKRHLSRKNICKPIKSNIDINIIYEKNFNNDEKEMNQVNVTNVTKCNKNVTKCNKNVTKCNTFERRSVINTKKEYQCTVCNIIFNNRQSLWRHKKKCNKLDDVETLEDIQFDFKLKEDLEEIKKELQKSQNEKKQISTKLEKLKKRFMVEIDKALVKKDKQMYQLINKLGTKINDNSKHLYLSVKLNSFKNTDYSHITDHDYLECIRKGNLGIPYLIEKIHFNPEKPENHNIFINNIKSDYITIYNQGKWEHALQYETINMMVQDKANLVEDRIEQWFDTGHKYTGKKYKEILDKFPRFLNRLTDSKYVGKKVEQETKLLMFNKKDIVLDQKNKMVKVSSQKQIEHTSIISENLKINDKIKNNIIKKINF